MWPFSRKSMDPDPPVLPVTGSTSAAWAQLLAGAAQVRSPVNALEVSAVMAAVRIIAEDAAALPASVVRAKDGAGRAWEVVQDHPAHRILSVRPNEHQSPGEMIEMMTACAALCGAAVAVIGRNARGEPITLTPIAPHAWTIDTTGGRLRVRVTFQKGPSRVYERGDIMLMRGLSLDIAAILSPISAAREAIGLSATLEHAQKTLADKGSKASGIITLATPLSVEDYEVLRDHIREELSKDGGGIGILDQGAKFEHISISPREAQLLESREAQVREIARVFRIAPHKLGVSGTTAYASVTATNRDHYRFSISPWVRRFEEAFHFDVLRADPELRCSLDEAEVMRHDPAELAPFISSGLGAGGHSAFMTVNEARDMLGLPRVEGAAYDTVQLGAMNAAPSKGAMNAAARGETFPEP